MGFSWKCVRLNIEVCWWWWLWVLCALQISTDLGVRVREQAAQYQLNRANGEMVEQNCDAMEKKVIPAKKFDDGATVAVLMLRRTRNLQYAIFVNNDMWLRLNWLSERKIIIVVYAIYTRVADKSSSPMPVSESGSAIIAASSCWA